MQGYTAIFDEIQTGLNRENARNPTHVFVQGGVGAFAASAVGYYSSLFGQDKPRMIVVEPLEAACLFHSASMGDGRTHHGGGTLQTIMAGLAGADPSPVSWPILWDGVELFLKCPDYVTARAMRMYADPIGSDPRITSGESGAVTLGALSFLMERKEYQDLRNIMGLNDRSRILLVNTEGDTDPENYRKIVWEGHHPVPDQYMEQ
ncbi:pyridoxal-phosphate dependent enzyme [bacterium]|nr:pyridoxal-phosphate dependent enzyme [candidate division CSSED10-310 bacterium]